MYVSMHMMTMSEGARKTELLFIILYFLFANINKKMIYNVEVHSESITFLQSNSNAGINYKRLF